MAHYHLVNPRVAVLRTTGVGETSHDRTFFSERAMDRAEFYADFLAPWGFRYYFGAPLANDSSRLSLITVQRSIEEGPPGSEHEEVFQRLFPHVRRALEVHARLRASELRAAIAEDAIDRVALGMLWLDARGRVVLANRAALRLAAGGALAISGARLRAEDPASRAELDRAVARATGPQPAGSEVIVHAPAPHPPLALHVVPLGSADEQDWLSERHLARALVLIGASPPARDQAAMAGRLFGLTDGEAAVCAALLEGLSLREHARARGVGLETVRTHLARARAKLGARTQADVVRILMRALPSIETR